MVLFFCTFCEGHLADEVRKWFAFNDHKVELAQKSDVLNSRAYLLFYVVRTLS